MPFQTLQRLISNISGTVRHDTMEGREYLVAPMVMIVEGVHTGNSGIPVLYEGKDIKKFAPVYNHKPVVVYHPEDGHSACEPEVLTMQKVGIIMNSRAKEGLVKNKKLIKNHAEAWLEESRITEVDPRILEAIESDSIMELSTGLWTDLEEKEGTWNGEEYQAIARNYGPDHLALLPDREGACSIADGAGFLRLNAAVNKPEARGLLTHALRGVLEKTRLTFNQLSFNDITCRLREALGEKYGRKGRSWGGWVADVFDSYVIFYDEENVLHQHGFTITADKVTLTGEPVRVEMKTEYQRVANATPTAETKKMEKKEKVNAIISNEKLGWGESDRVTLEGLTDAQLDHILPPAAPATNATPAAPVTPTPAATPAAPVVTPAPAPVTTPARPTFNEILETADPALKEMIQIGLQEGAAKRTALIKEITTNAAGIYTEAELAAMNLQGLTKLAAAVKPKEEPNTFPLYAARADFQPQLVGNAAVESEGLPLPGWDEGEAAAS